MNFDRNWYLSLHGCTCSGGDRHEAVFLFKEASFNLKSIWHVCVHTYIFNRSEAVYSNNAKPYRVL